MIHLWADERLCAELPALLQVGEGQNLEFKSDFPEKALDLAKSVAAFATSGGGRILIGIANDSSPAGIPIGDAATRDAMGLRAQNSINSVRPTAKTSIRLGVIGESLVICIEVASQQPEPVYYHDHRPMVRDVRQSRPATPDEVKDNVWSHPSSEMKRKYEELQFQQAQTIVDSGRQFRDELASQREHFRRR